MAIRSGRFRSERTIVTGRASTYFRVLNSADFISNAPDTNSINVHFGNGAGDTAIVKPTFSMDFFATSDIRISGSGVVEGIYDALPNLEMKSGRFKTRGSMNPTVGVEIIVSAPGGSDAAIYRIFNSGPTPIQLKQKNRMGGGISDFQAAINEGESLDFVTPSNKIIIATGTGTANDHIEGIYDFIATT